MMPTIPEIYQRGLLAIAELGEDQMERLMSTLETSEPALDTSALESGIVVEADIPANTVSDIMYTLTGNYVVKVRSEYPVTTLVDATIRSMDESGIDALQLHGEERERFKDRLARLLSIDSFDVVAKASDVLYDHEHAIHSAKILTDIRPVYTVNPPEPPAGAAIVHMLKINFLEADEVKEFFVALDTDDVDRLIQTLERAKAKANSLRSVLQDANLRLISVK